MHQEDDHPYRVERQDDGDVDAGRVGRLLVHLLQGDSRFSILTLSSVLYSGHTYHMSEECFLLVQYPMFTSRDKNSAVQSIRIQ